MRVARAGFASTHCFSSRALPALCCAALLAPAFAGAVYLRGQRLAAATSPPAQASAQVAKHDGTDAEANGPCQQIGQLYQLATDLKAEVTKTDQNVLSVNVVRKATAIEQLAHKMRTGGGAR